MRNVTVFTLVAMLSACNPSQIQTAVAEIDVPEAACEAAKALAQPVVDDILGNDWRFLAPLWWTVADASADETYCRSLVEGFGEVVPDELLIGDPIERAALTCSHAVHVMRESRVVGEALATAGMAKAVYSAVMERHGAGVPGLDCLDSFFRDQLRSVGGV